MGANGSADNEIIYVGDPMCSWCWGFAPVARELERNFEGRASVRLILGGLRPGPRAQMLDERLKQVIRPHWERVEKMTGQPFNYGLFERDDFLFDTEPPSRAVVFARRHATKKALPVFLSLQEAFYKDNLDITRPENLAAVIAEHDLDADAFLSEFDGADLRSLTEADFAMAGRMGAQGFPTVLLRRADQLQHLTVGYRPYKDLLPAVERFFA